MKLNDRTFCASALVMALAAITYAYAGGTAGGTLRPGVGSMTAPNDSGYGSPDVTRGGVGAMQSSPPTGRSNRGKANGLNMGTRSGANSDVNRPRYGPKENSQ
ncbi:hypothetical protein OKW41_009205 [Paraburkholderia sp. UCT70]